MMKVLLHKLIDAAKSLSDLSSKNLPVSTSFKLSKVIRKVDEESKLFEEVRIKKAAELGTISEDGKMYVFSEENNKIFSDQIKALLLSEISLDVDPIPLSSLGDIQIEPKSLVFLDWLVVE